MEQRNQMLRELRLNKKESMGVVSVNNFEISFVLLNAERTRTKKLMNFFFFAARHRVCRRGAQEKIDGESNWEEIIFLFALISHEIFSSTRLVV